MKWKKEKNENEQKLKKKWTLEAKPTSQYEQYIQWESIQPHKHFDLIGY